MSKNQKKILISVPSKTFLVGEYAVLQGGPALLVNTEPRFVFSVTKRAPAGQSGCQRVANKDIKAINAPLFHPQSVAGQWLSLYPNITKHFCIESMDPHKGQGGFGFSSAQFNLLYLLHTKMDQLLTLLNTSSTLSRSALSRSAKGVSVPAGVSVPVQPVIPSFIDKSSRAVEGLLTEYKKLLVKGGGAGSGADVVSQWLGGVCEFSLNPFRAWCVTCSLSWPFKQLDFVLIRTGVSLRTHAHLQEVKGRDFSQLSPVADLALKCVQKQDQTGFVSALDQYSACLKLKGLIHPKALRLLKHIRGQKQVVAVKACGALGAEVMVVFFHPRDKQEVCHFLKRGAKTGGLVAHLSQLSPGISLSEF